MSHAQATPLSSKVPAAASGRLLADYLATRFAYRSRDAWRQSCRDGAVMLRGRAAASDDVVRTGDVVTWLRPDAEPPVARDIQVLHQDQQLVVAVKPAHLPSHADGAFQRHTFVQLLRDLVEDQELSLVHRLDRETSGVMVVARQKSARGALQRQFQDHGITKRYLAIVRGVPAADRYEVDAPIGRDPASNVSLRRAALAHGAEGAQPAHTSFTVLTRRPDRALLACVPHTGRTHQIRVHLCHLGHPLLGDKLYGRSDAEYLAFVHAVKQGQDPRLAPPGQPSRQLLHAASLGFDHPASGQRLQFEAPLPAEMQSWLGEDASAGSG